MKYIQQDSFGAFDLTRYEEYLEREVARLEPLLQGADILAMDRFVPSGPRCFHDARFEALSASTGRDAADGAQVSVELCLKGPFFDRHFWLRYEAVSSLVFRLPRRNDDLIMHEVRREHDSLVHELQFSGGGLVEVVCERMLFEEVLF